jgi:hypothetical protein
VASEEDEKMMQNVTARLENGQFVKRDQGLVNWWIGELVNWTAKPSGSWCTEIPGFGPKFRNKLYLHFIVFTKVQLHQNSVG